MREENEKLNNASLTPDQRLEVRRRRAMYRCQQRGLLEVDVVMGNWSKEKVPSMDARALNALDEVLAIETLDMLNIISKRDMPLRPQDEDGSNLPTEPLTEEDEDIIGLLEDLREYAWQMKHETK